LATKFTYKMRSGGKGMWGRGPALYKHNYLKKIKKSLWGVRATEQELKS
jgi:hypothetical protein